MALLRSFSEALPVVLILISTSLKRVSNDTEQLQLRVGFTLRMILIHDHPPNKAPVATGTRLHHVHATPPITW
jgi:hypothetical protein